MTDQTRGKVTADHLDRMAYLYVRQSSLRQVVEHGESTRRQYDLRGRAISLGWDADRICVIDSDLGRSGADSDRAGFRRLVTEVSLGNVGMVLGLEVSRLARNNADWQRLLELCAQSDTLILDEDGIYDPSSFNDRLLLGLKGTMSEAELHVMKSRLRGGLLAKARRGELKIALPVGYCYDPLDRWVPDPDAQVQETLRTFFDVFQRSGSARAVVAYFNANGLLIPLRSRKGPGKGELFWNNLDHGRALSILHNPGYAGVYAYGRTQRRRRGGGRRSAKAPRSEWIALIKDHHPGYISWERFEANQAQLARSARAHGADRRQGPAREGTALLQGMAICGKCGNHLQTRYDGSRTRPRYVCHRDGIANAGPICLSIAGAGIDRAVADLALELMTPQVLQLALGVQDELERRLREADGLRSRAVQRVREAADLAGRRYRLADPHNRMVADVLEAEWNACLQRLEQAGAEYERRREQDRQRFDSQQQRRIAELATNFPRVWNDPGTPARERKRMLRLLVEDVTVSRGQEEIRLGVRLRGGVARELTAPLPMSGAQLYRTPVETVALVDEALEGHTIGAIVEILRQRDHRPPRGARYTRTAVQAMIYAHGLRTRYQRLRDRGLLSVYEVAGRLGISESGVRDRRRRGLLVGHLADDKGVRLYEWPPGGAGSSHAAGGTADELSQVSNEAQYAT